MCEANGIVFRLSFPYTSSQNGKSERKIRSINNIIRTLLIHASLPSSFWHHHYKKCCIFPGAEALTKMQKALANGRLPGVLPGAQSPAILVIANHLARALAPGKFTGFCRLCQHHISHFQTMPGTLPGVNPWQNANGFFKKKNVFYLLKKSKY